MSFSGSPGWEFGLPDVSTCRNDGTLSLKVKLALMVFIAVQCKIETVLLSNKCWLLYISSNICGKQFLPNMLITIYLTVYHTLYLYILYLNRTNNHFPLTFLFSYPNLHL